MFVSAHAGLRKGANGYAGQVLPYQRRERGRGTPQAADVDCGTHRSATPARRPRRRHVPRSVSLPESVEAKTVAFPRLRGRLAIAAGNSPIPAEHVPLQVGSVNPAHQGTSAVDAIQAARSGLLSWRWIAFGRTLASSRRGTNHLRLLCRVFDEEAGGGLEDRPQLLSGPDPHFLQ